MQSRFEMSQVDEPLLVLIFELTHQDAERRGNAIRQISQSRREYSGITGKVIGLVADNQESIRNWSCEALESTIKPSVDEVPELIRLLRETKDGEVEYWSATMLGRLGTSASAATAALASCLLDSPCLAARERAAWAIAEIGPPAQSAINALKQITTDDPPRLQRLAASAIHSLAGRAA